MRFDEISGWLELDGFSLGINNSASTVSGGGGAGLSTSDGVALNLGASAALTTLTGMLLSGKHLQDVEIEVYRTGLDTKDVLIEELRFENVSLSGLNSGNATQNLLYLDYDQISRAHRDIDATGKATAFTSSGWDFKGNMEHDGPAPVAGAIAVLPLDSVSFGTALDYYIHFEGVSGSEWLSLGSFSFGMENSSQSGGGGGGAGKAQVSDVVSTLGSSATTTALLNTIGSGKILNDVEIEVYRPGGAFKDQLVAEYKFSGVVLTGLDNYGGAGQIGTGVSFDYLGFGQRHISFDSQTGQPTGEATASFDFLSNTPGLPGLLPQSGAQAIAQPSELQTGGGSNLEYYVRFDGINGWLELDSYSLGIDSSLSIGVGGLPQVGKATAGDVALSLGASAAFTTLTANLLSGKYMGNVEIEVYRPGDKKDVLIDEFRFEDVFITSLESGNATSNALTFAYDRISHAHRDVDGQGQPTNFNKSGWDFKGNFAFVGPNAVPDADGILPLDSVPAGADLDYYIYFEGISGQEWLQLGAFSFSMEHPIGSFGGGGGGGGAGKVSASDVYSVLGSSATGTKLLAALGAGEVLDGVEIEVYRSGLEGKDQLLAEYRFSDVVLTELRSLGSGVIGNDLSFDFGGFGQRYLGFDSKTGQATGETTASWDFGTNTTGGATLLPQSGEQATAGSPEAQMTDASQLNYYVRFDGVNGWLQLETFQFGASNSATIQTGGGAGAGVSKADSASLTLGASAALTTLTGSLLSGQYLNNVEIEVYLSGGKKDILIDEFRFEDVFISGLDSANVVNNLLYFDFERVSHSHRDVDSNGQTTPFTTSGWDFAQNTAFTGPNPNPDVDFV